MELPEFQRDIVGLLQRRLAEPRRFIQVVTGPRQTGKTTGILQVVASLDMPWLYAVADVPAPPDPEWIGRQWDMARARLAARDRGLLVLDEVQKVSRWAEVVKRFWDEDTAAGRPLHVVVLGSSALLVKAGLEESLAGRFEMVRCPHWSFAECRTCFGWSLDSYLFFGGYPGAARLVEDESRWAQYVRDSLIETTISRDVLLLRRVEKPALLRQLFVLACEYAGQVVAYQKLLGQLRNAGNTTTLSQYQHLLEGAYLIRGLPRWSGTAVRRRASSPKWVPLNTALVTSLAGKSFGEWRSSPELWGRLVETSVGAHLANKADEAGYEVYYWRGGKYEVDFVLRRGDRLVPIEVKSGRGKISAPGLSAFSKRFAPFRTLLVGGDGIPLHEFLEVEPDKWFEM